MTVEARINHLQGVPEQPRPPIPFSSKPQEIQEQTIEPTQKELGKIVSDLLPLALEIIDPYVSGWAGEDWKTKGLPNNSLQRHKTEDFYISYFGSIPQGGPAQILAIRKESGEGILFQKANPEAKSITGKKNNYIYWDGKTATRDRRLGEEFLERIRKKDPTTAAS